MGFKRISLFIFEICELKEKLNCMTKSALKELLLHSELKKYAN